MKRVKLGACLVAASMSLGGATFLAVPAEAAEVMGACGWEEWGAAISWANGFCGSLGLSGGLVTSCSSNWDGSISISGYCAPAEQ